MAGGQGEGAYEVEGLVTARFGLRVLVVWSV